jgi:hypothetical protein
MTVGQFKARDGDAIGKSSILYVPYFPGPVRFCKYPASCFGNLSYIY